jgi:hypothetical protein
MEIKTNMFVLFFGVIIAWQQGQIEIDGEWVDCHPSWKTCDSLEHWNSWEDHMFLEDTAKLWTFWSEGHYFDKQIQIWRVWDNSCLGLWRHQQKWFKWDAQQYYDLNTFSWVESWPSIAINVNFISFWRDLKIYIDPDSSNFMQLGTKGFPFRSLGSAFIELVNYHSHRDIEIEILIKEGSFNYVLDDMNFIINTTSVKVSTYGGNETSLQKATLILTNTSQIMYEAKSLFTLHSNSTLRLEEQIEAGQFTEKEVKNISRGSVSIVVLRSNFSIENMSIIRDYKDFRKDTLFLLINYLQDKLVKMQNLDFNITGSFITSSDPFNGHFSNIFIDAFKLYQGFYFYIQWNYPEAAVDTTLFFDNITVVISHPREDLIDRMIITYIGSGNLVVNNSDFRAWHTTIRERIPTVSQIIDEYWLPDDGQLQQLTVSNSLFSLENNKLENDRSNTVGVIFSTSKYRKAVVKATNNSFTNYENQSIRYFLCSGTSVDDVYFSGNLFSNLTSGPLLSMNHFVLINKLTIENAVFENGVGIRSDTMILRLVNEIVISNMKFDKYNCSESAQQCYLSIFGAQTTKLNINKFFVLNWDTENIPLIRSDIVLGEVKISKLSFRNIVHSEDTPLIYFFQLQNFEFYDHQYYNVKGEKGGVVTGIEVSSINLNSSLNSTISGVSIEDWHMKFINLNSVSGSLLSPKQILIERLNFTNSHFYHSANLIESGNIQFTGELYLLFDRLLFSNISYAFGGNLLLLKHQLSQEVIISNSKFLNTEYAGITIESGNKQNKDLQTKVVFGSSVFDSINGKYNSLIRLKEGGFLKITNWSFTNISTYYNGAVLYTEFFNTRAVISDSVFQNNSASEGAVFYIESESIVECYNWLFQSNFALTGGVVSTINGAYFEFFNSTITQNYAIADSICSMIEGTTPSIINSWTIFKNGGLSKSEIHSQLVDRNCKGLWFVSEDFVRNVYNKTEIEIVERSELFQLILSSIIFENSTQIYLQSKVVDAYISSIKIVNSSISDIDGDESGITISSSNLEITNSKFQRISSNGKESFIFALLDNNLIFENVTVADSEITLFRVLTSKITINSLFFVNMRSKESLLEIFDWEQVVLRNTELLNSTSDGAILFSFSNSSIDVISNIQINGIDKTAFYFHSSYVKLIENVEISHWLKAIHFKETIVEMLFQWNFTNNGGQNITGGALLLQNSNLTIINSSFTGNSADVGGAIAFTCSDLTICSLSLENIELVNNCALVKGGGIYYDYRRPTFTDITFTNNSASYGNEIASYPVRIKEISSDSNKIFLDHVGPSIKLKAPLILKLVDYDDQTMVLDSSSQILIQPANRSISSLSGFNSESLHQGIAIFENITFLAKPGSQNTTFLTFSKAINVNKIKKAFKDVRLENEIIVNFRFCRPGENIGENGYWTEWGSGQYSLQWNSPKCNKWMDNAIWLGGTQIYLDEGYWRNSLNSTKLYKWRNKEACLGQFLDREIHPTVWEKGYKGKLCKECEIIEGEKYQRVGNSYWRKCPEPVENAIKVSFLIFGVFIFLLILILINVNKIKESNISILLKILTNYIHLISSTLSISMNYPETFHIMLLPIEQLGIASDTILNFDCFIHDYEILGPFPSNAVFKIFLTSLLPLLIFMMFTSIWTIIYFVRNKWVPNFKRQLAIMFVTIILFLHPNLIEESISIFKWIQIDHDKYVVDVDTEMDCFSHEHIKWIFILGLPSFLMYAIVLPVLAFFFLKKTIHSHSSIFLVLHQGLKSKWFYWEFVNIIRKTFIVVVFFLEPQRWMLASFMFLIFTTRIQLRFKPFKDDRMNHLELSGVYAVAITLFAGMVFEEEEEESVDILNFWSLMTLIIFNALFFYNWIVLLLECYKDKARILKM